MKSRGFERRGAYRDSWWAPLFARIMSRARVLAHSSGEYRDSETIGERAFWDKAVNMAILAKKYVRENGK